MRHAFGKWVLLLLTVTAASALAQQSRTESVQQPNPGLLARQPMGVDNSMHNLAPAKGGGAGICKYCHAPHHTAPVKGLWNHQLSGSQYQFYTSSTYKEGMSSLPSNSPSRLCLSCHDGTVALGSTYNSKVPLTTRRSLSSTGNLGVDLRNDHPFAFDTWVRDNTLRDELFSTTPRATANSSVKLPNGRIECTTCHEPHIQNIDIKRAEFLVVNNANGAMCQACHDVNKPSPNVLSGWPSSAHAVAATAEGAVVAGYGSVAEGACMNCHTPHGSGSVRLLRGGEENACYSCHANSSSPSRWAQVWVGHDDPTKFMHPVQAAGHDPNEDPLAAATPRHSKCWDCHDAHATRQSSRPTPPAIGPALAGATGVDRNGNPVVASYQYEVCFKCHADSPNKPQTAPGYVKFGYTPMRQIDAHNVRLDLNSALARHNVVSSRSGVTSPAYRAAILRMDGTSGRSLTSGYLYCTDCHNDNNAQSAGGMGPNGPHISAFEHLLERRYDMNRPTAAASMPVMSLNVPNDGGDPLNGPFALCNKCHDVRQLLSTGDTVFRHHVSHVVAAGISCAVCHAPHGVQGSDAAHHGSAINLDLAMVGPDPATGRLEINTAARSCYVSCHFSNAATTVHSGTRY